jgi:phosphotransacetylase/acyl dehydratase
MEMPLPLTGRCFAELAIGETAALTRRVTRQDAELHAIASGDAEAAQGQAASSMVAVALISAVLDTRLPGAGTICLAQDLRFPLPASIDDVVTAELRVMEKRVGNEVLLHCRCTKQDGAEIAIGMLRVRAPAEPVATPARELPDVRLSRHDRFHAVIAKAATAGPIVTAVAHPCDGPALLAAAEAADAGLISPILVGPAAKIRAATAAAGIDAGRFRQVDAPHSEAAAAQAVALVRAGEAAMLMKGSLHTDELLHAVLAPETGLRTARRLSHIYVMDVPGYSRPIMITDAAVNIAPDLLAKRDIVQNAIELAQIMGIDRPAVAILSAVETVNPDLRSTLDAAALCKMAERGQITGGIVDGPLALDNAVSMDAAAEKGIASAVAGRADILVVPDLEAGNMLAKQLTFLVGADAAGLVLGARVPIVLTSRADAVRTRLASCAVAVLAARHRRVQAVI